MNKEEILKKAQTEKVDEERELQVKDKSMMWSYIAMVIVAAIFLFIRSEQGNPMMDFTSIVSFSVLANQTYRFNKTKEKQYLIVGFIALCVAITATIRFMMGH